MTDQPSARRWPVTQDHSIVLKSHTIGSEGFEVHGIFPSFAACARHVEKDADLGPKRMAALLEKWVEGAEKHEINERDLLRHALSDLASSPDVHWCASRQPRRDEDGVSVTPATTPIGDSGSRAGEVERLTHVIDRDRYIAAACLGRVKKALSGRAWLREAGRGPYAYDDERYQQEFGWALDEIEAALVPLERLAMDKTNCTTDPAKVLAARVAGELVRQEDISDTVHQALWDADKEVERLRAAFMQTQIMLEQIVHLNSTNFQAVRDCVIANRAALAPTPQRTDPYAHADGSRESRPASGPHAHT